MRVKHTMTEVRDLCPKDEYIPPLGYQLENWEGTMLEFLALETIKPSTRLFVTLHDDWIKLESIRDLFYWSLAHQLAAQLEFPELIIEGFHRLWRYNHGHLEMPELKAFWKPIVKRSRYFIKGTGKKLQSQALEFLPGSLSECLRESPEHPGDGRYYYNNCHFHRVAMDLSVVACVRSGQVADGIDYYRYGDIQSEAPWHQPAFQEAYQAQVEELRNIIKAGHRAG